ncbi:isoamyl acetate-hydrolyzing esterase [Coemansia biformis]|uniref:Isoamyl acetate-hydrolyzing esterase n=1 Tax=Coemansia biformis TaxID=1286918 RepID=A0A9W7Y904_9FUNG|nr:isoamyl acetate-hydrolyzing esterase [Coemansia biformis]
MRPPLGYLCAVLLLLPVLVLLVLSHEYLVVLMGGAQSSTQGDNAASNVDYHYPSYDVLLAFGDSITQMGFNPDEDGYLIHLARYYERLIDVVNRGFAGYDTRNARRIVGRVFPQTRRPAPSTIGSYWQQLLLGGTGRNDGVPAREGAGGPSWPPKRHNTFPTDVGRMQLCILFFGTNDSTLKGNKGRIPVDEYANNLRYLVSLLRDPGSNHYSPDTRILFITPPAIGDRMVEHIAQDNDESVTSRNSVTKGYAQKAVSVAKELGIPYVDFYSAVTKAAGHAFKRGSLFNETTTETKTSADASSISRHAKFEGYDEYLVDGIHLNANGNRLLFRLILKAIQDNWPELVPRKPPIKVYPPKL